MSSLTKGNQFIQLQNPVADQFDSFIFGNALFCDKVVKQDEAKGKHVIICGAGPSLADNIEEWSKKLKPGDQVWGCNSALTYLVKEGYPVTHGITVDQTPHMVAEWRTAPDVKYLLASTVHPNLTEMLTQKNRSLTWFHNFVGINKDPVAYGICMKCKKTHDATISKCEDCGGEVKANMASFEDWMYWSLYPPTIRAGSGLNTVTRAIDVALFMGFGRISVLGADCALRLKRPPPDAPVGSMERQQWLTNDVIMHADGGNALASEATPVTMGGVIDGRHWETKPDMVISAVWLVNMQKKYGRRLKLVGDTLPVALQNKPKKFMDRLPQLVDSSGRPLKFF